MGQFCRQSPVGEHIPRPDGIALPPDPVEGGVLIGHIHRLGINVHRRGPLCPQHQGRDGQDAAAAAQVQHPVSLPGMGLHPLQTQLGGGVGPRPEGEPRVQIEGDPSLGDRLLPLPLGDHIEAFSDGQRFIVLLPAVRPVVVHQGSGGVLTLQAPGVPLQLGPAVRIVGDIELHPGDPPHPVQQLLVHIVPILAVLL